MVHQCSPDAPVLLPHLNRNGNRLGGAACPVSNVGYVVCSRLSKKWGKFYTLIEILLEKKSHFFDPRFCVHLPLECHCMRAEQESQRDSAAKLCQMCVTEQPAKKQTDGQTDRRTDSQTARHSETDRQTLRDRQTDTQRQTDRQTESHRQTDRQTYRHYSQMKSSVYSLPEHW